MCNIFCNTLEGCLTGPKHLNMPGDVWCKVQTPSCGTWRCASPLCAGVGYAALGLRVGQYLPDCDSVHLDMTPMTSIAASSRLQEGDQKKNFSTLKNTHAWSIFFRPNILFSKCWPDLVCTNILYYRGHQKVASAEFRMPVMERASRMRLMHRLLYWGVPEETRLTRDVTQCT